MSLKGRVGYMRFYAPFIPFISREAGQRKAERELAELNSRANEPDVKALSQNEVIALLIVTGVVRYGIPLYFILSGSTLFHIIWQACALATFILMSWMKKHVFNSVFVNVTAILAKIFLISLIARLAIFVIYAFFFI